MSRWNLRIFSLFVFLSLLTPFWVFKDLLFPYVTSKAFSFRIAIELALPFYVYLVLAEKKLRPNLKNPINISALLFLAINIVTSLAGVNITRSLWGNFERMGGTFYLTNLLLLLFYVQLLGQAGGLWLKRFLQAFIAVASAVTLNGISGWLHGPTLVLDPSLPARVSSTFGNPIFFPSYLIVPMFFSLYFGLEEETLWKKALYFLGALLQLAGIYSSGTRGAVMGLVIGLFVSAVIYVAVTANKNVRRYGAILIAVFVLIAGGIYSYHGKLQRGSTLYRLVNLRDSNTEARLIQWHIALRGFKEHPLLGVGPENYYAISNQYYNTALYQYDASWFDKPHNFLLEVLVTNGLFGLAAYLAMLLFSIWALWRAFKADLLSPLQFALFVCAFLAYQIQNLFVFDTVSASGAYYILLGFAAFLWQSSRGGDAFKNSGEKFDRIFLAASFSVTAVVAVYVVYVLNVIPMRAAKNVNYGFAYASVDPKQSVKYFETAVTLPFNFDMEDTAGRYSDFAGGLPGNTLANTDSSLVLGQMQNAIGIERAVAARIGNDPVSWQRLANLQMTYDQITRQPFDDAETSVDKAVSLVPNRVEVLQSLIQLRLLQGRFDDALVLSQKSAQINPFNPYYVWQVALVEAQIGQTDRAAAAANEALDAGYQFRSSAEMGWLMDYYTQKKDYPQAIALYAQAIKLSPDNVNLYVNLAKIYAASGDKASAIRYAQAIMQGDPSKKQDMEALIQSLQ